MAVKRRQIIERRRHARAVADGPLPEVDPRELLDAPDPDSDTRDLLVARLWREHLQRLAGLPRIEQPNFVEMTTQEIGEFFRNARPIGTEYVSKEAAMAEGERHRVAVSLAYGRDKDGHFTKEEQRRRKKIRAAWLEGDGSG